MVKVADTYVVDEATHYTRQNIDSQGLSWFPR
jgi:hypothetical protein